MAENINISFAPNKNADEAQRIADIENYLQTLTERTKFALASIIENAEGDSDDKSDDITRRMMLQAISDSVGMFTNDEKNSEIFNNYYSNIASGYYAHAEGTFTKATEYCSHAEGNTTEATSRGAHSEGGETKASGPYSHAEGYYTVASGDSSHAEGIKSEAQQTCSHAEGSTTIASGYSSHAEGVETKSSGDCSHAEGSVTQATGSYSHAEGSNTIASGTNAHTEGYGTKANQRCTHAEGDNTIASAEGAHAEGFQTEASGTFSHTQNWGTVAENYCNTAIGKFNEKGKDLAFVVGNGTSDNSRSNAMEFDWEGNLHITGRFTADGGFLIDIPIATSETLGGVIIGNNITVADDGTISVDLSGYLKSADISAWAKQPEKPVYTASEVGAAEEQHTHSTSDITDFPAIPTKVSELQNDSGYISEETDPTVPAWAKAKNKPTYTAEEVGAAAKSHTHTKSQITDFPASLPANGGNADTVDGKHASDFATARHTHTATEVGAATAADITAAITDIKIGGRNLLYYSRFDKKYPNAWAYSAAVSYTFDGNAATLTKAETASRHFTTQTSVSNGVVAANPNLLPENGCTYTISCEVMKAEGYDVGNGTKITNRYNFTDGTVKDFDVDVSGASETVWTKYSRTYTYASDKTVRYTQFIVALGAQACGIRIKNVKFEKGNKATDWSPAPEDDEQRIASLEARVAALEAAALAGGE